VRNVTVALDDETYRRVRVLAAELDTSVSGLVKSLLAQADAANAGGSVAQGLKQQERALRKRIANFRASDRLARDEAHARER
jgi:predicted transcriptional regulator